MSVHNLVRAVLEGSLGDVQQELGAGAPINDIAVKIPHWFVLDPISF